MSLLTINESNANESVKEAYSAGVQQFRQQNYQQSLLYFLKAESLGLTIPKLYFNLGSAYFKLQKYSEAYRSFERSIHDPQLAALAYLNLAICAAQLGNQTDAQAKLNLAITNADTRKLIAIIKITSDKYDIPLSPDHSPVLYSHSFSTMVGNSGNIVLPDNVQNTKIDGNYVNLTYQSNIEFNNGTSITLGKNHHNYQSDPQLDVYDYDSYFIQPSYRITSGAWVYDIKASQQWSTLDQGRYLTTQRINLIAKRKLTPNWLASIGMTYDRIKARQQQYNHLAGKRREFILNVAKKTKLTQLTLTLNHETNNRNDIYNLGIPTTSYSPSRNSLHLKGQYSVDGRSTLGAHLNYRQSLYPVIGQAEPQQESQQDRRQVAELYFTRQSTQHISWFIKYLYIDNHSNQFQQLNYYSHNGLAGLTVQFSH